MNKIVMLAYTIVECIYGFKLGGYFSLCPVNESLFHQEPPDRVKNKTNQTISQCKYA